MLPYVQVTLKIVLFTYQEEQPAHRGASWRQWGWGWRQGGTSSSSSSSSSSLGQSWPTAGKAQQASHFSPPALSSEVGSDDFSWHTNRHTLHHNIYIIIIFTITLLILGQFCVKYPIPHQHPLPLRSHFLLELKVCHKIDLYSTIITLAQPVHVSSIWHLPLGGLVDLCPDGGGSQSWAGGLVGGQLDLLVSEQLELLFSEQPQLLISGQLELWSDNSISIRRLHTKARLSEVDL